MKFFLLIPFIFSLSSCTPARIVADNFNDQIKTSKVKIKREKKIIYWGLTAIIGYDSQDKIKISNGDVAEINVPVGNHEFFVRSSQADKPAKLNISIEENKITCLKVNSNPSSFVKTIIWPPISSILFWFDNAFEIAQNPESCE